MLNRTITVLPVFLVIVLGIVVGFAVLGLRGPERELRDARHAIDREDFTSAIRHLDRVKNEIDIGDAELQEKTTRMRALTYERLGDRKKSVRDLDFLIDELQINVGGLVRDRIRLLNEIGAENSDPEFLDQALRYCKRWLASNREDGIVLGLAGHSRQILADIELAKWKATFENRLPEERRRKTNKLIHEAIYSTNPSTGLEIDRMSQDIDGFVPGFSQSFYSKVEQIRKIAQAARGWFLRGLSSQYSDASSYEGIASQLRIAGDDDSLLMLAHAHLSRVTARDSYSAGFDLADIHLRHKRYQACLEIAQRVLPVQHIQACFHDGSLDFNALKLLACHAVALSRIGSKKARRTLLHRVGSISYKKRPPYPRVELKPYPLTHFILGMLIDEEPSIEAHLGGFSKALKTNIWFDERLAGYTFRRLAKVVAPESCDTMYGRWMHYRPRSVQPIHEYVKVLLSRGDVTGANRELNRAIHKLSDPDSSLELLIETQLRTSGLDLAEVTERASRLRKTVPDEIGAFPALTIAIARQALSTRHVDIALACTIRAKHLYPRSRIPHYLHANILIASNDPGQAARVIALYLKEQPDDQKALQILAKARNAAGRSTDDLRYGAILNGTPDLLTSRYLAHRWLERGEFQRVLSLANSATRDFGIDLEMQVLATRALMQDETAARNGVLTMLRAVFHLSRGVKNPSPQQAQLATWALGQYALYNPEQLTLVTRRGLLTEFLARNQSPEDLHQLAAQLTRRLDFELALRCYRDLAQDDRYKEFRQATHFEAAAHVALRLDDTTKARELLAAAMAFDEGSRATLNLALLDLAQGDEPDLPKNLAIDSLLAASLVARQEPALAVPFLAGQLKITPNHLGCQCVAAVLSQKALVSPHVRTLATKSGANLISLVALLEQPPFGRLAMRFAQTLVDENPGNPAALLLLAKASGNADRPIELQAAFDKIRNHLGSDIVLMTAAFQILSETEHPALQQSKIKDQLAALALRGGASTPPALLALVLKQNSAILKVPGAHNKILPMVKKFWLCFPAFSGIGL
ncbi:MAG: hypothetical protein VX951_08100 [Planctomycetota bacterium]|nr:hypothetical protein [Planctomycetota bacterium]